MATASARRDFAILAAAVAAAALGAPVVDTYARGVLTTALVFVSLTAAWHLVGGYLGQLSIGHTGVFGAGAYAAAIAGTGSALPLPALLAAGAAGGAVTAVAMAPAFRARGTYFAIATLGVTGLLHGGAVLLAPGGNLGIVLSFRFTPYSPAPFYWAVGLSATTLAAVRLIMASRHGRAIRAIRDDEEAASSLGTSPVRCKVAVLLVSAALTGMLGGFYAVRTAFVDPDTAFDVMLNIRLLLMAILGGMGTFGGPVLGALTVSLADEFLRVHAGPEVAMILYALLLLILTLWAPQGIAGILRAGSPGRAAPVTEPVGAVASPDGV